MIGIDGAPREGGPGGGGAGGGSACELGPLHASEAKLLLACPRKWKHEYLLRRVPREKGEALSRGTAVHVWLALWWAGQTSIALPEDPIARACCIAYGAYYGGPPTRVSGTWNVEQRWTAVVGGVACEGTVDAASAPELTEIVEHKTTSQDISPGSLYWRQVVTTDPQVSMYRAAFPRAKILYDVIRKPALRKLREGKPNEETEAEFVARCVEAMAKEPERYFQRAYVVRLESEDEAFARDVVSIDRLRHGSEFPRNPASCFAFGGRCGHYSVCWEGADLMGPEFRDQDEGR